jgi:hypothetical protein
MAHHHHSFRSSSSQLHWIHKDLCIYRFRVSSIWVGLTGYSALSATQVSCRESGLRHSVLSATQVSHRIIIERFRSGLFYGQYMDYGVLLRWSGQCFEDFIDVCRIMDVLGLTRLCIGDKLRRATGSTASCGAFDVARNIKGHCGTCTGCIIGSGHWVLLSLSCEMGQTVEGKTLGGTWHSLSCGMVASSRDDDAGRGEMWWK